jgi:toxin ParE1/3/4
VKRLVVTDAARGDLEDIARHGDQQWGTARTRRYMDAIRERFARLRHTPGLGAPRDDIRPGYRSIAAGRHVVFYRETQDHVEIVRVLHERMDLHRRLTEDSDNKRVRNRS